MNDVKSLKSGSVCTRAVQPCRAHSLCRIWSLNCSKVTVQIALWQSEQMIKPICDCILNLRNSTCPWPLPACIGTYTLSVYLLNECVPIHPSAGRRYISDAYITKCVLQPHGPSGAPTYSPDSKVHPALQPNFNVTPASTLRQFTHTKPPRLDLSLPSTYSILPVKNSDSLP